MVFYFFLYFLGIKIAYIPTNTCYKKLSATFLWVSNFYIKLRIWNIFPKLPHARVFLKNHAKSIGFQLVIQSQNLKFSYFSSYIRVASLYNVPSGSKADLHVRSKGPSFWHQSFKSFYNIGVKTLKKNIFKTECYPPKYFQS